MSKPVQYRRQPDHQQQPEDQQHPDRRRQPERKGQPGQGGGPARPAVRRPRPVAGGPAGWRERRDRRHGPGLADRGPGGPPTAADSPVPEGRRAGYVRRGRPRRDRSRAGRSRLRAAGRPRPRPRGRGGPRGGPPPQPVALAVAADAADFACLSRYRMFGPATYEAYLRRTESQLRALRGQGWRCT
ncbi:hypothetical protein ACFSUJ_34960 [Streptomyces lusitanus]|uniref:hypothetical protein n=1 Tax=Streptomyces lusitanus TaxID=68232 RepID=UPI00363E0B63